MNKSSDGDYRMTLRMPSSLHDELSVVVAKYGTSSTQFIVRAVREALDREKNAAPAAASEESRAKIEVLSAEVEHMKETIEALRLYIEATRKIEVKND